MAAVVDRALHADVVGYAAAVTNAALCEAQHQAHRLVGEGPLPGTPQWEAEQDTPLPMERQRAWQLACLRIELAAGMDALEEVVQLRRCGASWTQIAQAAAITRQSAHERWSTRVLAVLDRYGTGQLGGPVVDDDALSTLSSS